jgi:hypothetical protein
MHIRSRSLRHLLLTNVGLILSGLAFGTLLLGMTWAQDAVPAPAPVVNAPAPPTQNMLVKTWVALGTMYAVTFCRSEEQLCSR